MPKTEHQPGHEEREIPIFPELVEPLLDAQEQAERGSEFVIKKLRPKTLRDDAGNFRSTSLSTRFKQIIRRAGLEPWPKPFVNLRASRDTELRESFPGHVVEAWIGHGDRIAKEHYLMVIDDHYRRWSPTTTTAGHPKNVAKTVAVLRGIRHALPRSRKTRTTIHPLNATKNGHMRKHATVRTGR